MKAKINLRLIISISCAFVLLALSVNTNLMAQQNCENFEAGMTCFENGKPADANQVNQNFKTLLVNDASHDTTINQLSNDINSINTGISTINQNIDANSQEIIDRHKQVVITSAPMAGSQVSGVAASGRYDLFDYDQEGGFIVEWTGDYTTGRFKYMRWYVGTGSYSTGSYEVVLLDDVGNGGSGFSASIAPTDGRLKLNWNVAGTHPWGFNVGALSIRAIYGDPTK